MTPEWLLGETFRVEHNPNCPSPFLVRLCGFRMGKIHGDRRDACGYGQTLETAAEAARASKQPPSEDEQHGLR